MSLKKYTGIATYLEELEVVSMKIFNITSFNYDVAFSLRSSRRLGTFMFQPRIDKMSLKFNPAVIDVHGEEKYLSVVRHEFGHMITRMIYGSSVRPHGPEWKQVMRKLGDKNPRATTGDFNIKIEVKSPFIVKCGCPGDKGKHRVSESMYLKFKEIKHICKRCNEYIKVKKIKKEKT
jgi:SprT protein